MGRAEFGAALSDLQSSRNTGCDLPKMVLYPTEIRQLLKFSHCR
jgi:hypothetical protein